MQINKPFMTKQAIQDLIESRKVILGEDIGDIYEDTIQAIIMKAFKDNHEAYPVDFIIETLTHFGQALNLIYDDNGHFAVSVSGFQPISTTSEAFSGDYYVFVEKEQWFDTIRKALWHYLNSDNDKATDILNTQNP